VLVPRAHSGIVWKVVPLSSSTFATCSVDKTIKIFSDSSAEPIGVVSTGVAINSISGVKWKGGEFKSILAGSFQGDLMMISVASAKVQEEQLSQHDSYVSSICTLNIDPSLRYACSISYDCFKVWNCTQQEMVNVMTVPVNFTNEGNYRWWDICEIKQSLTNPTAQEKVIVGCSSSKDSQTRVYRLNLITQEHNLLYKLKQTFHPRSLFSVYSPNYPHGLLISVGLIDDIHSPDGVLQVFNMKDGNSIEKLDEKYRLCSITSIKPDDLTSKEAIGGQNFIFVGTCDKRILQYHFDGNGFSKDREIETTHKKSIFGLTSLSRKTLVSIGLDAKLMLHYMTD